MEKNWNKYEKEKNQNILRGENLIRNYVQYGVDGEKEKEIRVLKGLNFNIKKREFV